MGHITLRQIPPSIEKHLRDLARRRGSSLNKTIISLLARAPGMDERQPKARDLSDLAGTWTEEEARAFDEAVASFEQIDDSMRRP